MGLRKATLTLRRTTRQRVNETTSGASQGYANASPDYETTSNRFAKATLSFADNETTSQQDNEWDFASQTTRLLVNKTTSGASLRFAGFTDLRSHGFTEGFATKDKRRKAKGRLRLGFAGLRDN